MSEDRYNQNEELKGRLDELYRRYNRRKYVTSDPLLFLYRYPDAGDREIAGLIASALAFGNVKQIINSVGRVLDIMGESPRSYLLSGRMDNLESALTGFKHRWIDSFQISRLLLSARDALRKHGTLEKCFESKIAGSGGDINKALSGFVEEIDGGCLRKGFIPCPEKGSPCKRLNLYIRWMVRSDRVDPGGWSCVSPSMLTVPLDTHMYRLSRKLGFTERSQRDMITALEITDSFRELAPDDPVKYDFALTRLGIIKDTDMRKFEQELEELNC